MHLTREEERILAGEEGWAKARALEVVVKVGEALGAERLQPIAHAHVSGLSYFNIGEAGRKFIADLAAAGARVSVPTTSNPIGFDLDSPGSWPLSIGGEAVRAQVEILRSLERMGVSLTLTCTPYYLPDVRGIPRGSSVAWGESSAVVYANSVLGLRTNREGGPLALMAAIAGRTYYYGMHVDSEREPSVLYEVQGAGEIDSASAGVIGEILASRHKDSRPPMLDARLDEAAVRELSAAVGAAGDLAMVYIRGVTPEPLRRPPEAREAIGWDEVRRRLEELAPDGQVDLVYVGCPHADAATVERLARALARGRPRPGGPRLLVTMSRAEEARLSPEARQVLRRYGAVVLRDTCLVVSSVRERLSVATDSYKAYFYLSRKGLRVGLEPTERLVERLAEAA